jgi:hypothetical protein
VTGIIHEERDKSAAGDRIPPNRPKAPQRAAVRLSPEELQLVESGLKLRLNPIYRIAWWALRPCVSGSDASRPVHGILARLANSGLIALELEMHRKLDAPDLSEDDEVFLMNDLRGVELTRAHLSGY